MPRTLNVEVHRVRRDAFLDVAQRLITTRGYEAMSIQDVLDELETSRGALYHYFDSKQALLDGVVERFAEAAMAQVAPILEDPHLPALRKLERVIAGFARFKAEQRDFVLALIEVWNSDANALLREKLRRLSAARLGPILTAVIRQGIQEGTVKVGSAEDTAQVIVYLLQGYQDLAGRQFVARRAGTISFDEVLAGYAAFSEAFDRILGLPQGSTRLMDEATLHFWYG